MSTYTAVDIKNLKYGDTFTAISLVTGKTVVKDGLANTVGATCLNYYPDGIKTDRAEDLKLIMEAEVVLLRKSKDVPVNWPPQENDVWILSRGLDGTSPDHFHIVNGKVVCDKGAHNHTPESLLAMVKGNTKTLKLAYRHNR